MWNRKLGRTADHRKAMLRNMATSLIIDGQIETTEMKAKELSAVVDKLFTEIGPSYSDRNGGYTRVVKTRLRRGDSAPMAIIELV